MRDLKKYIEDFMELDCDFCKYNKELCPKMFKNENEVPCVHIHKYLENIESIYGYKETKPMNFMQDRRLDEEMRDLTPEEEDACYRALLKMSEEV